MKPLVRTRTPLELLGAIGLLLLASAAAAEMAYDNAYADLLSSVEAQLAASQRTLEQNRTRKAETLAVLAGFGTNVQVARERLQRDARALYRVSRGGMLPLAGGMAALLGHASRVGRLSHLVEHDLAILSGLSKRQLALQREATALDGQIAATERELSSLALARAAALRERSVHTSFEAAFERPARARIASSRVQYGLSVVGGAIAERFSEQRGTLALPISGPHGIEDATRAESEGPGLEFGAAPGATVRAAAAGRVAFSDNYGSYGKLVIIDHGDRYYTVYGGLAQFDVQVGDDLSKSARVGSTGSAPLYFEVRRGTKTQDARAWLGL
jgi:septal ring factor EnvC (AmiA/AmiB activator)